MEQTRIVSSHYINPSGLYYLAQFAVRQKSMADKARVAEVQLEAMRVSDCSWHPCQVSLSISGSLVVYFESLDLEDVIQNVEELDARLRVRSLPLEADDCQHIEEGEHILVASKSNFKALFFNAVVQEVRLTRHSKRIICRCTFMIKWMHQDPDSESITVPSSLVMKLSRESVKIHPVVAAFLNSMKKRNLPNGAFTIFDEPYGEYDVDGAIGKQIEELRTLADGATRELLEDIIVRVKPGSSKGDIKEPALSHSKLPLITKEQNHLRRSNRNRSKMEIEVEECEPVITSSLQESATNIFAKEELAENRSPLNPLAARAALASLVSKLPQKLDFSFYEEEKAVTLESNDTTRLTHSVVQNDSGPLNEDVDPGDLDRDMIWDFKSRKQVTSAEKGEETVIRKVVLALRSDNLRQCTEPNSSDKDHLLSHAMGSEKKGAFINDELVEPRDLDKGMIWEELKSSKQLTLSADKGEETLIHKVVLALRNVRVKQCAEPHSSHISPLLPHTTGSKKKEAFINDELVEKNKKLKISTAGPTQKRNEDEGPQNKNSTLNQKRSNSLKQQPSRSSPRLNALPRTR